MPLSTERKPQQWVEEEKTAAATTTTTTKKKEKQVEVSTADSSKNVDSKYSCVTAGANAAAAVQSSDEKGRASEIARELAQVRIPISYIQIQIFLNMKLVSFMCRTFHTPCI